MLYPEIRTDRWLESDQEVAEVMGHAVRMRRNRQVRCKSSYTVQNVHPFMIEIDPFDTECASIYGDDGTCIENRECRCRCRGLRGGRSCGGGIKK
jgi:hypothetical protein